MNILITGNQGYIGSVMTKMLLEKGYDVVGLDTGFYGECFFEGSDDGKEKIKQVEKDIRKIEKEDFAGVDSVIHLAGLSNDPVGELDQRLTEDINTTATRRLGEMAKEAGVRRFLYASSCSMYGIAGDEPVSEESPLAPVTAYAISKVKSEKALSELADKNFSPVYLRPSTAYGVSPRLRFDLVVNNLVGWAYTTGKIKIMSDGTPWRPVIHVEDFCSGFIACLEAPLELVHDQAFNLGRNSENYRIKDIAGVVQKIIPGCEVEYTGEHGSDSRTYKVNFDKIHTVLKNFFHPKWNLEAGVKQLYEALKEHGLTFEEFSGNKFIRLNQLKKLMAEEKIKDDLHWKI